MSSAFALGVANVASASTEKFEGQPETPSQQEAGGALEQGEAVEGLVAPAAPISAR